MNDKEMKIAANSLRDTLNFQFDISWKMMEIHLNSLVDDEELLWRPTTRGLHVVNRLGVWYADWPDTETYDIGPPSIAWLTWHIIFWWSMVFDYSFGSGILNQENIHWPGNTAAVKEKIAQLHDEWKTMLTTLSDEELLSCERTKWPFEDKPFYKLAAWLNLELMKNAAEIGYCRFLYTTQE